MHRTSSVSEKKVLINLYKVIKYWSCRSMALVHRAIKVSKQDVLIKLNSSHQSDNIGEVS